MSWLDLQQEVADCRHGLGITATYTPPGGGAGVSVVGIPFTRGIATPRHDSPNHVENREQFKIRRTETNQPALGGGLVYPDARSFIVDAIDGELTNTVEQVFFLRKSV